MSESVEIYADFQRQLCCHRKSANQVTDLAIDARAPYFAGPRLEPPLQLESHAMPTDDRIGLHDGQRGVPVGQSRERQTQKARSRNRNFGRLTDCLQTASCCRRARFSTAKWALGMSTARRNRPHAFKKPIFAPSATVEIRNSSPPPSGMANDASL